MKKLLLLTLAIVTLISEGYSQIELGSTAVRLPIKNGGFVVYETDGHGLVAAPEDLGSMDWGSAKIACDELVLNGYSDWRLPTKEELNAIYVNLVKYGARRQSFNNGTIDDKGSINFWSSTEYSSGLAWGQRFDIGPIGGGEYYDFKKERFSVRAVRDF